MTKRFTYLDYNDTVRDNETGKEYHTWYEDNLLDLLNELADENEQLKEQNEHLEKQLKCITQSLQSELNYHGFMSSLR